MESTRRTRCPGSLQKGILSLALAALSACNVQLTGTTLTKGAAVDPNQDTVSSTSVPAITGAVLVDLKSGAVVDSSLNDGDVVAITTLSGRCLSVRVTGNAATSSVGFGYDGNASFAVENTSPYDLMGSGGSRGCIPAGSHSVSARPYKSDQLGGTAGETVRATFTVRVDAVSPSPSPTVAPTVTPTVTPVPSITPTPTPMGKVYHFSSSAGDDSRTATQAQDPATPWKSVAKINWLLASGNSLFQAGDSVLLRRGDTFYGSIQVQKSGDPGKPITIGAYGSGAKPVVTLFETLGNWVSVGSGVWESICRNCGDSVRLVTVDGQVRAMGRWPNASAANGGYRTVSAFSGNTSITDSAGIPASPSWVGAEAVVRCERWVLDRFRVTAQTSSTLTFEASNGDTAKVGFGYFIQNHPATLDEFGEWYYQPSTKKLRFFFGSAIPAAHPVQASTGENLVHVYNQDDVRIQDLALSGANQHGIYFYSADRVQALGNDLFGMGHTGIQFSNLSGSRFEGNSVRWSGTWGINGEGGVGTLTVRRNRIENTANFAGMGAGGSHSYTGLRINGSDNLIEYNEIRMSGYNGIRFNGNRNTFRYNLIERYSMVKDDSAGIYTGNPTLGTEREGNVLANNIILDGMGAAPGTGRSGGSVSGIYVDDNGSGVEIRNNTIARMPLSGIFIHNAHNLVISGNTVMDTPTQLYLKHDNAEWPTIYGVQVDKNLFYQSRAGQKFVHQTSIKDDLSSFTTLMDYNRYANPWDDGYGIGYESRLTGRSGTANVDLWRPVYGKDANSAHQAKRLDPYQINGVGTERIANGAFAASKSGVSSTDASWVSSGGIDGGSIKWVPSDNNSILSLAIGSVVKDRVYRLRFSVRGTADLNLGVTAYLRTVGSPYDKLTPEITRTISSQRKEIEIEFQATQSYSSSVLHLALRNAIGKTAYVDNVSLVEATSVTVTPVTDLVKLHYNAEAVSKTIPLEGNWVDSYGNARSGSVTLAPFTSIILMKN